MKVSRIIDDLINTLDFQNKSEIAVSGVLKQYWQWVSESETESKPKNQKKLAQARFHCLFAFRWIPNTKLEIPYLNLKYPIKPKRGGYIPNSFHPYLELCHS